MGGAVAYLVAAQRPDQVERLIVEDVPPPFPRDRSIPERLGGGAGHRRAGQRPDLRYWKHLPDISAPTLLIGGGATSHILQDKLVEVAKLLPNCSLLTIPAGHQVHETQPAAFTEAVLTWLGGHVPQSQNSTEVKRPTVAKPTRS